jgi:hypothetical protein
MSIHRDHVAQLLESLADTFDEVVAGAEVEPRTALRTIDRTLADTVHTRPETLHLQLEQGIEGADPRVAAEIGRLLDVRAQLADQLGDAELADRSHRLSIRALRHGLGASFHDTASGDEVPAERLRTILRDVRTAEVLTTDTIASAWRELFEFEADRQHYPKAEDCLFHALRLTPDPQPIVEDGLDFYDRLLELPDEVLERRGLPRDEVEDARAELEERRASLATSGGEHD